MSHLITEQQFETELRELGERMATDGRIVIKQLLKDADNGRISCRFKNWPDHLQRDAYKKLNVAPVLMYRRLP